MGPVPAFGLSTSVLPFRGLPEGLKVLADVGAASIEINGYSPRTFDFANKQLVAATRKTVMQLGLRVWSFHSPAYKPLDLASADHALRQQTCTVIRNAMLISREFEPHVFVCDAVPPAGEPDRPPARRALYADSLQRLLAEATQLEVRLVIENHTGREGLFVTPDDFFGLLTTYGLDGLGACWDTGHGWISGQPPEAAGRLGRYLITLHVHDNDGQCDQHRVPMSGTIQWGGFVQSLRSARYDGPLMMEVVPGDRHSAEASQELASRAVATYHRLVEG